VKALGYLGCFIPLPIVSLGDMKLHEQVCANLLENL
jgi:hypothetical protein